LATPPHVRSEKMGDSVDSSTNSLIYDYLSSTPLLSSIAQLFKKKTKASELPQGSPQLKAIIKEFHESPQKRKSFGGETSPQKKLKKDESSSDSSSSDEEEEVKPKENGTAKKSTPGKKTTSTKRF